MLPTSLLSALVHSLRNNFVLIYELLDEVLDYGYPQNCSTDVLKLYITQQGDKSAASERAAAQAVTIQVSSIRNAPQPHSIPCSPINGRGDESFGGGGGRGCCGGGGCAEAATAEAASEAAAEVADCS